MKPPAEKVRSKRPFVLLNMAMTADGKIASANRAISSFTSKRDHDQLLALRATADAVMCGAHTANSAQINLGPGGRKYRQWRLKHRRSEFNLRIVVSGTGSIDPEAEIFKHPFGPIIVLTTTCALENVAAPLLHQAEIIGCGRTKIDFSEFLRWLRAERNVKRLVCEGGGELNDVMFRVDLVDEVHLTVSPRIFGGRNAPTISEGTGFGPLSAARKFELKSASVVGREMFLVYRRK